MGASLAVRTMGSGPPLLLVHGGVGPRATWTAQEALAERWRLVIPSRRCFGHSPRAERQDYENDAADLAAILDGDGDPAFERFTGIGGRTAADIGPELDEARRLARGMRMPDDAALDLAAINAAGVPSLVVSGGHHPGMEVICDELAGRLAARRERVEGAGHAARRAPGFNRLLERFLRAAPR